MKKDFGDAIFPHYILFYFFRYAIFFVSSFLFVKKRDFKKIDKLLVNSIKVECKFEEGHDMY